VLARFLAAVLPRQAFAVHGVMLTHPDAATLRLKHWKNGFISSDISIFLNPMRSL
jgi:hypothetical protein